MPWSIFILSFAYITYASNIYIVWGIITLIPILFFTKRNNIIPFLFTICFFFFVCLYYVLYGIEGGFRILKTYTICLTFIILSQSKQEAEKIQILLKPLHYFMTLSAWIVCIDFVLYWGGGHTIMNLRVVVLCQDLMVWWKIPISIVIWWFAILCI